MGKDLTVPEGALSETVAALNAKQRAFVEALFTVKPGHGSLVAAARVAGYGENSTPENLARIAFRLAHNPKVVAAIQEITAKSIRKLGPATVRAVKGIVTDPTHRDQLKAARTILEGLVTLSKSRLFSSVVRRGKVIGIAQSTTPLEGSISQ